VSKTLTLTPKGLYTYFNNLASVPEGSLLKANNTVINREGILEPRRGIKYYSEIMASPAKQLLKYKSRILRHVGSTIAYDNASGTFTDFAGNFNQPNTITRIKSIETKGNLYFTSDIGVQKLSAKSASDFTTSSIKEAGGVVSIGAKALLIYDELGFVPSNQKTAYKITWAYKDTNDLFIEGIPSNSVTVENFTTENNASAQLEIFIPYEVTNTDFIFRVFRCELKDVNGELSDEYNLVFEGNPTSGELSAKKLFYVDRLSEDFRLGGTPLYTNPISGGGINSANFKPPFAVDVELFNNHVFYANTRLRHFKEISLQDVTDFTTGVSNFIISDGTNTETYVFVGSAEVSTIAVNAYGFITNQSYFFLNSANNETKYFVWFDKSGSTVEPVTAETYGRVGIKVDISSLSADITSASVAAKVVLAVQAVAPYDFTINNVGGTITVANTYNGYADATADSTISAYKTHFTFNTTQNGDGENASLFEVFLSDDPIDSSAVQATAQSLVRIINQNPNSIVTAQYISGTNDSPGKILLIRKTLVDTAFITTTTDTTIATAFYPNLSADPKSESSSSQSVNAIYFSKQDEPESVPLLNVILVGSSDAPILRIKALRESLFIFKTDGLFRLSGFSSSDFTVSLFDNTILLKVPDSVAVLNNEIYYYGTQGVAKVSEVGKDVISKPIQDKLLPFITTSPVLAEVGFGIAYETDRSYMLWTVLTKNDTVAKIAYRFNVETGCWTSWQISKTCAVLNNDNDTLYFGSGDANVIEIERKNFDRMDYADREILVSLPTLSTNGNIIKPSGASQMEAGDVLIQTQYITIARFNQLLKMLDIDVFLSEGHSAMYPDFSPLPGENLASRITSLVNELNVRDTSSFTDTWGNTSYVFSGTNNVVTIQTEWNKIVDRLNQSPTVFFSNYPKSTGSVNFEGIITARNISNNDIYLKYSLPFLEGDITLYKAIATEVEYVPQHGGDPINFKQFSTAQAVFEYRSFFLAKLGFNSDLSTDFEYIDFSLNSAGNFGDFVFGDGAVWGGAGDKAPLRTYIPRKKQRSRFIGARFQHTGALETYSLYGIAITFNEYSDRAYK
jgi:hypothetical protein